MAHPFPLINIMRREGKEFKTVPFVTKAELI